MSPRVFTAVLAAALAGSSGSALAQSPPEAAPVGRSTAGGPPSFGITPGEPVIAPIQAVAPAPPATPAPPPALDPAASYGPALPTDSLMSGGLARGPKAWVGAEYLIYWTKDAPLNGVIATAGPGNSTALLGSPGTRVVIGNSTLDYKNFSGVRVFGGYWFTNNESIGLEGNFFILPEKHSGTPTVAGAPGLPTLARPFLDTALNRPNSRVLSRPGFFNGGLRVDGTQELWGAEALPVWRFFDRGGRMTFDALTGFKFVNLNESLTITDFATAQRGGAVIFQGRGFPAPATTTVSDGFRTDNSFYGGVIGLRGNYHVEAFIFSLTGKLGLGTVNQELRVNGSTTLTGAGPAATTSTGGFFIPANASGKIERDDFAVVPEVLANLSVQVTSHLTMTVGYNFLAISDVIRPGDQLSSNINPALAPWAPNFGARFGPPAAGVPFRTTDFWAHGINVGLAATY
jgi:hypothetical protein